MTKAAIVGPQGLVATARVPTEFDVEATARQVLQDVLKAGGLERDAVGYQVATGTGATWVSEADQKVTEIVAAAAGANFLVPGARTVMDVGAEDARAIRVGPQGQMERFATNDQCAAGTGSFVRTAARMLEVPLDEAGRLSLQATEAADMSATCVVFAETEIISQIHAKTPRENIMLAIHVSMARRLAALVHRVGAEEVMMMCGGMGWDVGFVEALRQALQVDHLEVPDHPDMVAAVGAAVLGVRDSQGETRAVAL
jgi:predicted CoA-substrate-specific enzyme activase